MLKYVTDLICLMIILLCSVTHSQVSTKPSCPSVLCSCSGGLIVSCTKRRLERIPHFTPDSGKAIKVYDMLDLSRNEIYSVPPKAFHNIQVKSIDLSRNNLIGISPRAFKELESTLLRLNLYSAGLRVLHWGVFKTLQSLQDLDLTKNQMFAIPRGLFDNLHDLENLKIAWNKISEIRHGTFRNLHKLSQLNLMGNQISVLDHGAFSDLRHLIILNLNSNKITTLYPQMFHGLDALQRLDLQNNVISYIPDGTFLVLPQLKYLSLARNNLTVIHTRTLLGVTQLEELSLQQNMINNVSSKALLSTPNLKILHLADNQLTTLGDDCALQTMTTIRQLWLQGNPLKCDCGWSWLTGLIHRSVVIAGRCEQPTQSINMDLYSLDFTKCNITSCTYNKVPIV